MNKFLVVLFVIFFAQMTGCASTVTKVTVVQVPTTEFLSACDRDIFRFNKPENRRVRMVGTFALELFTGLVTEKTGLTVSDLPDPLLKFYPSKECLVERRVAKAADGLKIQQEFARSIIGEIEARAKVADTKKRLVFSIMFFVSLLGGVASLLLVKVFKKK